MVEEGKREETGDDDSHAAGGEKNEEDDDEKNEEEQEEEDTDDDKDEDGEDEEEEEEETPQVDRAARARSSARAQHSPRHSPRSLVLAEYLLQLAPYRRILDGERPPPRPPCRRPRSLIPAATVVAKATPPCGSLRSLATPSGSLNESAQRKAGEGRTGKGRN
jgi:hypothetical protein